MTTSTLIWLFPVVFILHDLEEIIMVPPWIRRNGDDVVRRFPITSKAVARLKNLSASGFAMAVLLMFCPVVGVTVIAAEFGLHDLWAGAVLVLLLHFAVHFGQFIAYRAYIPVIATSLPGAIWCAVALATLWTRELIGPLAVGGWALAGLGISAVWFLLAHRVAARFDRWLHRADPAGD